MYKTNMEKVTIEIRNLSKGQARAIEEYFAVWDFLNQKNMSMWCSFFVDCQSGFIPSVKVNGEKPKRFMKDIGVRVGKVKFVTDTGDVEDDMYLLDYERVAKALNDDNKQE